VTGNITEQDIQMPSAVKSLTTPMASGFFQYFKKNLHWKAAN